MTDKDNEELRLILDKMASEHVAIPWKNLPDDSPIKKFVQSYNYYHDKWGEGEDWVEAVLAALTNTRDLDDLNIFGKPFGTGEWYVCAQLLKSGFAVRPNLMGELLEKILMELSEIKADITVLGIKKSRRGRPSDDRARRSYLGWLRHEIRRLTTQEGVSANQAYDRIGKKLNKAADTIRRDYERHMKQVERRKKELELTKQKMEKGEGEK